MTYLRIMVLLVFAAFIVYYFCRKPDTNKDWSPDQVLLPNAEINGDIITIHNVRNFVYTTEKDYTPNYYDKTVDLNDLETVDFVVEPFSGRTGIAHTFLTFGFKDKSYIAISIEVRKQKGEHFSALLGLFKHFQIVYMIADENDVIKMRSNYRKDEVYLYPVNTTKEKIRALFLSMIKRANELKDHPEFYNSINNTCTTNIVKHVNIITPKKIPWWDWRIYLPAYSDIYAYQLGIIGDGKSSFEELKTSHLINKNAMEFGNDPLFSEKIRKIN